MAIYKYLSFASFIISAVFMGMGFHKLFVYKNPESYESKSINSYVGGDAYNYIINSNYATGYFVLTLIFVVLGCSLLIVNTILNLQHQISTSDIHKKEDDLELIN